MKLDEYISDLLFEHDCVIVPGFGGFVCNYSPATIQPGKNRFNPPFKKISFNRSLKNNDGLLANRISQGEMIPYPDANNYIAESVEHLNKELAAGKRCVLKNIGALYNGKENTLLFQQDESMNYLPEAFGLGSFTSPAIKREPIERKIERKLKDKVVIPVIEKKGDVVRKRIPVVSYLAVAASLLIIASLGFILMQPYFLKNAGFANLNPFGDQPVSLYHAGVPSLPENDVLKDHVRDLIASNSLPDTTRFLKIMINGSIPIVVSLQDDKTSVAKSKSARIRTKGGFHIIGGAFAVPENAERFVAKLIGLGYDAQIIDKKLHMVSYGNYATREEALQAIEKIRTLQSDVWLMKM
jgi:hypothetical protein